MTEFIKKRAVLENEYAKKLQELCKTVPGAGVFSKNAPIDKESKYVEEVLAEKGVVGEWGGILGSEIRIWVKNLVAIFVYLTSPLSLLSLPSSSQDSESGIPLMAD